MYNYVIAKDVAEHRCRETLLEYMIKISIYQHSFLYIAYL